MIRRRAGGLRKGLDSAARILIASSGFPSNSSSQAVLGHYSSACSAQSQVDPIRRINTSQDP